MPWPSVLPPAPVVFMWVTGAVLAALVILSSVAVAVLIETVWTRGRASRRREADE